MYLIAFPLLLVPFVLYNMVAFLLDMGFGDSLFAIPLLAGRTMPVTTGDVLIVLAVLLLYLEFVKAARRRKPVTDHLLSLLLLGGMAFEFAAVPKAATTSFLILLVLGFIDVLVGFSVRAPAARLGAVEPDPEPIGEPALDHRVRHDEPPLA